jgi:transcriptional regulator with XRE-family HTH domain
MLSTALIHEIDRLLKEGELSHRKIADRLGVSRGVVDGLANGRRGLYGKEPDDEDRRSLATATRCTHCGYRVYMPCLICQAREHKYNQNGE